jgi:diacylglycerol kinase (ATP)
VGAGQGDITFTRVSDCYNMSKAVLVVNPTAGGGRSVRAEQVVIKTLADVGIDCEVVRTQNPGDGIAAAREATRSGCELVLVAGGDGTINEVINGMVGSNAALGIIPVGSVNVLARDLGIPLCISEAVEVIASGTIRRMDLGVANGRYFSLMAGIGFDATVVASVPRSVKDLIGSSAYVLKAVEVFSKYKATKVFLDMPEDVGGGYEARAFLVVVANVSTYTYNLRIAPSAVPNDGLLDVCVFERSITDKIGFISQVSQVFINRHLYHKAVRYFRTPWVVVRSEPNVWVQLDGDVCGTTPVEIFVVPSALSVIVPSENSRRR